MQQVVDDAPPARRYFSDGFATYAQLLYPGTHTVAPGKSQTFSVEGDNAELRHYPNKTLLGAARSPEPLFLTVHLGAGTGGGAVCVRLEQAPALQAGFSKDAGSCLRFCCRFNIDTPRLSLPLTTLPLPGYHTEQYQFIRKEQPRTMITNTYNQTIQRSHTDSVGRGLTLARANTPRPAASFDGGLVF